jgi:hypothetical protein
VNDEKTTLKQLNRLCGTKDDIFFGAKIPQGRLPVEIRDVEIATGGEVKRINSAKNPTICSKILHHFIQGKIPLSLMETIFVTPQ